MTVVKEHLKQEVGRSETKKEQQTAGPDIWISFLTPADALTENNFPDRIAGFTNQVDIPHFKKLYTIYEIYLVITFKSTSSSHLPKRTACLLGFTLIAISGFQLLQAANYLCVKC
jgi:hypothetical protein